MRLLSRSLTPAQSRVLELMAEAMSYAKIGARLGITRRTARHHAIAISDALPTTWFPEAEPRERVILWAVRVYSETQTEAVAPTPHTRKAA